MDTRKTRVQEERMQNISALRAERGVANMTIPRRDLLTGTALVLMGSASGCGGSGTGSSAANQNLIRTKFMADFTDKYIGDSKKMKPPGTTPDPWPDPDNAATPSTRVWPAKNESRDAIANDYATFVNVLMTVAYVGGPPSAPPPNPALGADILQFLQGKNWPTAPPDPPQPPYPQGTVTLVEIAVILDRLLQAMNSFSLAGRAPGGGGSGWPPH
jgi:hypothetical protein